MRYHKTHLTRRLILETSADSEKEENMVEWLRVRVSPHCVCVLYECGCGLWLTSDPSLQDVGMPAEYVNKLARMFQDIKVSEDLNQDFKERTRGEAVAGEREGEGEGGREREGVREGEREEGRKGGRERLEMRHYMYFLFPSDLVNIKVLNAGAWSRSSERVPVSLPTEVLLQLVPFLLVL